MTDSIEFIYNQDYLLTKISDTSIVVEREVPTDEIMKLSHYIKKMGLNKILTSKHVEFSRP